MIRSIGNWWFRRRFAANRAVKPIVEDLRILRWELGNVAAKLHYGGDPVAAIVDFFEGISMFQDRDLLAPIQRDFIRAGRSDSDLAGALFSLHAHVKNAGRNQYGMNRTKPGELVTAENVFLGNYNGYWTKQVSYVLTQRDRKTDDMAYYTAMQRQAREFMDGHLGSMISLIDRILAGTAE